MADKPKFNYDAWFEAKERAMRDLSGTCPICGSAIAVSGECTNDKCDYLLLDGGLRAGWKPPTLPSDNLED